MSETINGADPIPPVLVEGLPVSGYRPQTADAIGAVNINKMIEESVLRRLDQLQNSPADRRCLALARTHIEVGFMWLNRGIFQPSRIGLPTDPPPEGQAPVSNDPGLV